MNERKLLEKLNETFQWELCKTDDTYCRWDAENEDYVVELKCRRAHYNTQMIEYDKLDALVFEARATDRQALYVCCTPKIVMIFNITKLCLEEYNFNWENKRLPKQTDFGNRQWGNKKVGYIDNNKKTWSIDKDESTNRQ